MGQTSLHADHTAGEDSTQAIGVEAGAKDSLDLILQNGCDFITAEVGHGDGVVTSEAKACKGDFDPT